MGLEYRINDRKIMKQLIKNIALFIVLILCFWSIGVVLNTTLFCLFSDMSRNISMNHFYMVTINKFLTIPAFFIAKYIIK